MRIFFATIATSYALVSSAAIASNPPVSVVFDSIMNRTPGGGHGFASGITEIGLSITLDGSARYVSQIDLPLQGFAGEEFRVRFYELNATGAPSAVIWESPAQRYRPWNMPNGVLSITVPNVLVPDSLAFTVVSLTPNSHLSLPTSFGASIGMHEDYWAKQGGWRNRLFSDGTFGARLLATVPEPAQHYVCYAVIAFNLTIRRGRQPNWRWPRLRVRLVGCWNRR